MAESRGDISSQDTQTTQAPRHERRRWLRPVAVAALGLTAAGAVFGITNRPGEAKAPHESVRGVAEADARQLAGDILDFYYSSPGNAQHREPAGEGDSYLQRATAYRGPVAYNFQLQSVGKGEITETSNLSSLTITTSTLNPATGEPDGPVTYDIDVSFDGGGIASINAQTPEASTHIEFHGAKAVDENGRPVSAEQVQQVFDQAEQRVTEVG